MPSIEELVDSYIAAWNASDEATRLTHLEAAWTDDGTFTDPSHEVRGRVSLAAHMEAVHEMRPEVRMARTSSVHRHDHAAESRCYFTWELRSADGTVAVDGVALCDLSADGRLRCLQQGPVAQRRTVAKD